MADSTLLTILKSRLSNGAKIRFHSRVSNKPTGFKRNVKRYKQDMFR